MSRNNETSGVELVVVGVFAFCLAVVAWLMKTFDVEWQTALETAPGLIVWLLVVGAGIFFGIKIHFEDVRPEEYTPSYAGSSTRVDFLLKNEKIIIELKKTRKNLKQKEVGEQLIVDIAHYQTHPDCETLVCFVYDPEGRIANPIGVENDLERCTNSISVKVIISPK